MRNGIGIKDCSIGLLADASLRVFNHQSAMLVEGWNTGGSSPCDFVSFNATSGASNSVEFSGLDTNMVVLGSTDFSSSFAVMSTREILSMAATSTPDVGFAAVCHTGTLASNGQALVSGGQNEQISIIAWNQDTVDNVTTHDVNAGCPQAIATNAGSFALLHNDGALQTLSIFSDDYDGDGFGATQDAFPTDGNQWSDQDADGFGDNGGFATSDDCPYTPGTSTAGRQGCGDIDGDAWADDSDAFPHDSLPSGRTKTAMDLATNQLAISLMTALPCSRHFKPGCLRLPRQRLSTDSATQVMPTQATQANGPTPTADGYGDNPSGIGGDNCPTCPAATAQKVCLAAPTRTAMGFADLGRCIFRTKSLNGAIWTAMATATTAVGLDYDEFTFDPTQSSDLDG